MNNPDDQFGNLHATASRRNILVLGLANLALATVPVVARANPLPDVGIGPSTITVSDAIPMRRPDTPLPPDPNLLFFIQHSQNANMIVYTARRGDDQPIDPHRPVDVFWRQFAEDGRRKELSLFERAFVFGVRSSRWPDSDDRFRVRLAAYGDEYGILETDEDHNARIVVDLGPHQVRLVKAYAELANRAFIPKISFVEVFGVDLDSGRYVTERVDLDM